MELISNPSPMKDTPNHALNCELWGAYCEYFPEKNDSYKGLEL